MALSETVRTSTWEDAKCTFNNPSLIGPPSVEFAIYKKVPSGKKRSDPRQGSIDQDPEFMAFLERLANPAPPMQNIDADEADEAAKAEAKVTTTPLIEYLKEKKANKAKDSASGKNAKHGRQESSTKGKGGSKDDEPTKKKGRDAKGERSEKTPKETVKILTKKAAIEQAAEAAKNATSQIKSANTQDIPKSRRAGIAAAARILQRDLGLSPGSAHRRARQDAAKVDVDVKTAPSKETTTTTSQRPASPAQPVEAPSPNSKSRPTTPTTTKSQPSSRRARGGKSSEKGKAVDGGPTQATTPATPPVILKKVAKNETPERSQATSSPSTSQPAQQGPSSKPAAAPASQKASNKSSGTSQKKSSAVTPNATRGFVKHANPSQGVTEAALKQALEVHGTITFVEIDKRKGFAYVDFSEHEGLVKAVTSSPIHVAQGTVQVLERKDKKPGSVSAPTSGTSGASASGGGGGSSEKPSGRGRRGRGGGGGKANSSSNSQSAAPPASSGG